MTTNSQVLITKPKKTQKQTKQTGTESQKWRSHRGLSAGEWDRKRGGKGTGNKQQKWQVENRQEEVKNSIGNVEANELTCTTHGLELKGGNAGRRQVVQGGGEYSRGNGTIVIA